MASTPILSPVGRFVQGDAFKPQTTDQAGKPLTVKTGPNAGQPTQRFFMAVAYSKADPDWARFYLDLLKIAAQAWPQFYPNGPRPDLPNGGCTHPRFSLKVMDGDGVDDNGKPNAGKEGFAGHWVVKYSSSFAPKVYHVNKYAPHEQITDPNALKRGWFVQMSGTAEGNGQDIKPGIYVNLGFVALHYQGDEITSGPDAVSAFAGATAPAYVPAGARALPVGAGGTSVAGMPPAPAMPAPPAVQVAPNPAFLAVPGAPPVPPAAPVGPQLTPAGVAAGGTYAAFLAAGWNDAQLRASGYLA